MKKLKRLSLDELHALRAGTEQANAGTGAGIWIYNPKAQRLLDAIAWEINERMIDAQRAAGTYAAPAGYSGRQSRRR